MNSLRSSCLRNLRRKTIEVENLQKFVVRLNHNIASLLTYAEDVAEAREKDLPIVALESTIITHGMPYPDNLTTALEVEDIIRQKGAVPATIAVLDGKIKVGANQKEIEKLAKSEGKNVIKVSRRDFSYAISQGLSGGTTVSGTMLVANKAGIPIMATGGIGGVHRQVELSMDISADLKELGQTPIAVVCSGVKAILDIPKTLEYLESEGVPVATLGPSDAFPAFYSRQTFDALQSPLRLPDVKSASRLIFAQTRLALGTGVLLAVPIPEPYALDPQEIETAIKQALQAAVHKNISGKSVTPFLLRELSRLTAGRSLQSNKALIKNNAGVAAEIALHLADLRGNVSASLDGCWKALNEKRTNPVVIGGATFDTILRVKEPEIKMNGSTHKGESRRSCGGVGRNLTAALVNLGMTDTKLLSVIGDDEAGRAVISSLGNASSTVRTTSDTGTARYTAVVDNDGNCCFGIGEMEAFSKINSRFIEENIGIFKNAPLLILDGNPPLDAMKLALDVSSRNQIPVWYEPTDLQKALKIFQCGSLWQNVLHFVSPNVNELLTMAKYFDIPVPSDGSKVNVETVKEISGELNKWIPVIVATLGAQGVLITRRCSNEPFLNKNNNLIENGETQSRLYSPLSYIGEIISVSGCGDCLAAGIITGILRGWKESNCILLGLHAAKESLTSFETVPSSLKTLPVIQNFYEFES